MRYLLIAILILLNGFVLFFLSKKYDRPFLLKAFLALIPIIMAFFLALGFMLKLLHLQMDFNTSDVLISAMTSLIVISVINFANQMFFFMVDTVVEFHKKNNSANINRQPIKFFIVNQIKLKQGATLIWFLGSALMLYGVWLGD